jgi:SAM-dependent methyltransferase
MSDGPYSVLQNQSEQEIARRTHWLASLTGDFIGRELAAAGVPCSATLLDVGSGIGLRACLSAQYLHEGSVIGLERDPVLVRYATERASHADIGNVTFIEGDARDLPFAAATFDAVRIDSVLWAVADPDRALAEASRVLKSDGVVLVRNFDMQGFLAFSAPELPRSMQTLLTACRRAFASWGGDLDIGHKLAPLLTTQGFRIESISASTELRTGPASSDERAAFWEFFEQWRPVMLERSWLSRIEWDTARHDYETWANLTSRQQARTVFVAVGRKHT